MVKDKIVYKPRELTFKEKRIIVKAKKNLFNNEEGKLTKHDGHWMWYHYCSIEKMEMFVGKGEACSWCGKEQNESRT
tara:strand:- start:2081 stop:2311 length:231 start_codon:yes stop_codon:yes gene_type:complete